jgi:hypothetical protein
MDFDRVVFTDILFGPMQSAKPAKPVNSPQQPWETSQSSAYPNNGRSRQDRINVEVAVEDAGVGGRRVIEAHTLD